VHAVVVLVPLAVLSALFAALRPAARLRYGWLAVALTAVATVTIPLTTSSGEGLRAHLPPDPLIAAHAHLGDELLPYVGSLLIAITALVVLDRYRHRAAVSAVTGTGPATSHAPATSHGPGAMAAHGGTSSPAWTRPASLALAAIVLIAAAASAVQVVRIGESGARAAWGDVQYVQPVPGHSE
jgi:hypothetical protein